MKLWSALGESLLEIFSDVGSTPTASIYQIHNKLYVNAIFKNSYFTDIVLNYKSLLIQGLILYIRILFKIFFNHFRCGRINAELSVSFQNRNI